MTSPTSYFNYIGGRWSEGRAGRFFDNLDPADCRQVLGRFPLSDREDGRRAIAAAQEAFPAWRALGAGARGALLEKAAAIMDAHAETWARELTREEGKPLGASREEWRRTAATFRFYAAEALSWAGETLASPDPATSLYTVREPLGVVSVITPWNFPASIPARKLAPALAAGNTVVFKPSSIAPLTALRLVEALAAAGLPAGVVNFLTGEIEDLGDSLVADPAIAAVSFTGSTAAGKHIHGVAALTTRVQLELGGKNALVVMEDADLELAVELAVQGGFSLSGQACTGTSRVLVPHGLRQAFVDRLCERSGQLVPGDGFTGGAGIGPLASAAQLERVLGYIELGKREARLCTGGQRLEDGALAHGFYVSPAVFDGVTSAMRIAQEEIFGPVICVLGFADYEEAIGEVNATGYGLSASIVTTRNDYAQRFVRDAAVGVAKVNRPTTGNAMHAPFGGVKWSSSNGQREAGRTALDFFTQVKTVYLGF